MHHWNSRCPVNAVSPSKLRQFGRRRHPNTPPSLRLPVLRLHRYDPQFRATLLLLLFVLPSSQNFLRAASPPRNALGTLVPAISTAWHDDLVPSRIGLTRTRIRWKATSRRCVAHPSYAHTGMGKKDVEWISCRQRAQIENEYIDIRPNFVSARLSPGRRGAAAASSTRSSCQVVRSNQ